MILTVQSGVKHQPSTWPLAARLDPSWRKQPPTRRKLVDQSAKALLCLGDCQQTCRYLSRLSHPRPLGPCISSAQPSAWQHTKPVNRIQESILPMHPTWPGQACSRRQVWHPELALRSPRMANPTLGRERAQNRHAWRLLLVSVELHLLFRRK